LKNWMNRFGAALLCAAAAHSAAARAIPLDGYAAIVNDRVITVGDVMRIVQPIEARLRLESSGRELEEKMRAAFEEARESLIDRALILESFERIENAQIPDLVVENRVQALIQERFGGDRAAFLDALRADQLTLAEFKERTKDNLILTILRRQEVSAKVGVTPMEIRRYYERNEDRYTRPEQVDLWMIVLKPGEGEETAAFEARVADARRRLSEGEEFAAVARDVSAGAKAEEGGRWGWVEPTGFREELADAIGALKPNWISPAIRVDDTVYLLKIADRRESSRVPLAEVQPEIEDRLRAEEEQRLHNEWIERLQRRFFVKRFDLADLFLP